MLVALVNANAMINDIDTRGQHKTTVSHVIDLAYGKDAYESVKMLSLSQNDCIKAANGRYDDIIT